MIKLLIADDHLLFRSMLEEMLGRDTEFSVTASCSSGEEAVGRCTDLNPDIALLDIGMPGMGGIEALRELKELCPNTKCVMLTTFEDDESIKKAVQLGADGYLIKDMTPETLILSLKCIHKNMVLFHRGAYRLLQSAVSSGCENGERRVKIEDMIFSSSEIKIMRLIVQGKSNKEISAIMNYSEGTIKNKISKILSVTGLSDRTDLSVFAINNAII
ncbi:MAG: response regulator [Eubacteriales bacterium]